ncbi:hypothetical protein VPH35_007132 [Triticum aestivum]
MLVHQRASTWFGVQFPFPCSSQSAHPLSFSSSSSLSFPPPPLYLLDRSMEWTPDQQALGGLGLSGICREICRVVHRAMLPNFVNLGPPLLSALLLASSAAIPRPLLPRPLRPPRPRRPRPPPPRHGQARLLPLRDRLHRPCPPARAPLHHRRLRLLRCLPLLHRRRPPRRRSRPQGVPHGPAHAARLHVARRRGPHLPRALRLHLRRPLVPSPGSARHSGQDHAAAAAAGMGRVPRRRGLRRRGVPAGLRGVPARGRRALPRPAQESRAPRRQVLGGSRRLRHARRLHLRPARGFPGSGRGRFAGPRPRVPAGRRGGDGGGSVRGGALDAGGAAGVQEPPPRGHRQGPPRLSSSGRHTGVELLEPVETEQIPANLPS